MFKRNKEQSGDFWGMERARQAIKQYAEFAKKFHFPDRDGGELGLQVLNLRNSKNPELIELLDHAATALYLVIMTESVMRSLEANKDLNIPLSHLQELLSSYEKGILSTEVGQGCADECYNLAKDLIAIIHSHKNSPDDLLRVVTARYNSLNQDYNRTNQKYLEKSLELRQLTERNPN